MCQNFDADFGDATTLHLSPLISVISMQLCPCSLKRWNNRIMWEIPSLSYYFVMDVTNFALKISASLKSNVSLTVSTSLVIWVNKSLFNMAFQLRIFILVTSLRLTATISRLLWWISLNYANGTEVHAVYKNPRSIKAIMLMSKPNQWTPRWSLGQFEASS